MNCFNNSQDHLFHRGPLSHIHSNGYCQLFMVVQISFLQFLCEIRINLPDGICVVTNIFAQMILKTKKAMYAFVFKKEQSGKTSQRKERRIVML